MSKEYEFQLGSWQSNIFFKPIREKKDILILLFEAIKYIKISNDINIKTSVGSIVLKVSKMSRFFFFSEERSFSISCPFTVISNASTSTLDFYSTILGREIDSVDISNILSLFNGAKIIDEACVLEFADKVSDMSRASVQFWDFIKEVMLTESGYLRYDHDPEREDGNIHPLKHLDIFYTTGATFKLGLDEDSNNNCIKDILDIQTDCHFLMKKKGIEAAVIKDKRPFGKPKN